MLDNNPKLKSFLHKLLIHPYTSRPRLWTRIFVNPFFIKRGKGSIIRRKARMDLIPSKQLVLGKRSIIEDYTIINNQMGDIFIGNECMILSRSTVIGPVSIGDKVVLGKGAQITALWHNYEEVSIPIKDQGVKTKLTVIEDDVWIGGYSTIYPGVRIGTHTMIAPGSIVTKSVPPYSIVGGNPAKLLKQYDFEKKEWVRVK